MTKRLFNKEERSRDDAHFDAVEVPEPFSIFSSAGSLGCPVSVARL